MFGCCAGQALPALSFLWCACGLLTGCAAAEGLKVARVERGQASAVPGEAQTLTLHIEGSSGGEAATLWVRRSAGLQEIDSHRHKVGPGPLTLRFSSEAGQPDAGHLVEWRLEQPGRATEHGHTVLSFARHVEDDLRYGFYANWDRRSADYDAKAGLLLDAYINAVEFYDYFPAHGHYAPTQAEYAFEPFGVRIDGLDVKGKIEANTRRGIRSIAYVAAYAASRSVYERMPFPMTTEQGIARVFNGSVMSEAQADSAGRPKWFWLMAIGAGSPWRAFILDEFARTLDDGPDDLVSFDGFEIDSYGHGADDRYFDRGVSRDHGRLLQDVLAEFVGHVRDRARLVRRSALVSFNCVSEFGIEPMKPVTDFLFIENWSGHKSGYREVVDLCYAHRAAYGQRVVLKMYPADAGLREPVWTPEHLRLLLGACIVGGGTLMVAGEPDERAGRLHGLNTLYYPDNLPLPAATAELMARYNRFDAMLLGLNHGRAVLNVDARVHLPDGIARSFDSPPAGVRTVMILHSRPEEQWNRPPGDASSMAPAAGATVPVEFDAPPGRADFELLYASPDEPAWHVPARLAHELRDGRVTVHLPAGHTLGAVFLRSLRGG